MATSEVDICNSALIKVGTDRIVSFSDNSKAARLCSTQYAKVRDMLLENHPWNFALKRYSSTALSEAPIIINPDEDFTHQHQLPTDFLKMVETDIPFPEGWKIEGDKLLCFTSTVKFKYIFRQTDVSKFSPAFAEALACHMAADLSYALAQTVTLTQGLYQLAEIKLREARSLDGQGGQQHQQYQADEWFNSRY